MVPRMTVADSRAAPSIVASRFSFPFSSSSARRARAGSAQPASKNTDIRFIRRSVPLQRSTSSPAASSQRSERWVRLNSYVLVKARSHDCLQHPFVEAALRGWRRDRTGPYRFDRDRGPPAVPPAPRAGIRPGRNEIESVPSNRLRGVFVVPETCSLPPERRAGDPLGPRRRCGPLRSHKHRGRQGRAAESCI
jgi:hypothetical protein